MKNKGQIVVPPRPKWKEDAHLVYIAQVATVSEIDRMMTELFWRQKVRTLVFRR